MAAVSFLSTNGAHRNSTGGDAQANAGQEWDSYAEFLPI